MLRPTEHSVVQAAAALIAAPFAALNPVPVKVVPRWILGLAIGEAITQLAKLDLAGDQLPVNAWVLTTSSWIPSKVKAESGTNVTPRNFTPGFDDWQQGGDRAKQVDYKITVNGSLKIWQIVEYRQGTDADNSEIDSMTQRQQVIDKFTGSPRLALDWPDFEHDELKVPAIAVLPFGTSIFHVAQGTLPFNFTYVVKPT